MSSADDTTSSESSLAPQPDQLEAPKTLSVRLPIRVHLRLHAVRITTGATLSEIVEDALLEHFEELGLDRMPGLEGLVVEPPEEASGSEQPAEGSDPGGDEQTLSQPPSPASER